MDDQVSHYSKGHMLGFKDEDIIHNIRSTLTNLGVSADKNINQLNHLAVTRNPQIIFFLYYRPTTSIIVRSFIPLPLPQRQ